MQWLRFLRQLGCYRALEGLCRRVPRLQLQRSIHVPRCPLQVIVSQIQPGQNQQSFGRGLQPQRSFRF